MKKRTFSFLLFLLFAVTPALKAEDVSVTSAFDKRSVHVNEEIHLTIRIHGARGNIPAPRLPSFRGFDTFYTGRASNITFINNVSTSSVEFSYVLVPKAAGRFTLDPIEVTVGGKSFRTDPVEIEVLADSGRANQQTASPPAFPVPPAPAAPSGAGGYVPQEPPPSFRPDDDNIFVKASVDKVSAYPNEQVLLSYSLYTRYDTRYEGFEEEPQVSGFWIEEFPMERDIARETVHVNGKRYVKADIKKIALFPTAPADYTIQPGSLKVSIREEPQSSSVFDEFFNDSFFSGGSFFARRENRVLKPPPIVLTVKPFPTEGKPENFDGAVGNYRLSSSVDQTSVKQNEPVTVKIVIEGEGNIETLNKPKIPELPNFKIYDSDTASQLFKTGNVIGGRKTFEIIFIPTQAGRVVIPKFSFSFFNPARAAYQTLQTEEFALNVDASSQPFEIPPSLSQRELFKKDIELESRDIRYIWDKLPSETERKFLRLFDQGLAIANGLLAWAVLFGLWRQRQERIFAKDGALKRKHFARAAAESRMRRLKTLGHAGKEKAEIFFEEIEKILIQYLSDKFTFSAFGTTRLDLEQRLEAVLGPGDPLPKNILHLFQICDESRFARGEVLQEQKAEALKILREAITRVEKMR